MLLVAGVARRDASTASARTACRRRSPASCTAPIVIARARDDHGVRPPYSLSADPRRPRRGEPGARRRPWSPVPGPNPRELGDHALAYEIERLTLELDDAEWQERSAYNRDAIAEAERDADGETIDRLSLERRLLNEQRRSLDRRRDQTRLLARPPVAAG